MRTASRRVQVRSGQRAQWGWYISASPPRRALLQKQTALRHVKVKSRQSSFGLVNQHHTPPQPMYEKEKVREEKGGWGGGAERMNGLTVALWGKHE